MKGFRVTIVYWGNIGIMDKKMETTIVHLLGFRLQGLGFRLGTASPLVTVGK